MSILIADDDPAITTALKLLLDSEGLRSEVCASPEAVLARIRKTSFDLALLDLNYYKDTTSGAEGLELISNIRKLDELIPIVVMTGWGTISIAVESMRRGASDFIEKPWDDNNRLLSILKSQLRIGEISKREKKLSAENRLLRQQAQADVQLVAESAAMQKVLQFARRVAGSDLPLLITGENGTGKSLLANYIHRHSNRADAPLITVNMGGISETTFESEMFGHVKGAFTDARNDRIGRVELAEGGTLFLDEIANTPASQQAKLLRLLEERQFEKLGSSRSIQSNARFISATNVELDMLVPEKGFRQDLLYRLNGVTLRVPALRERPEDIPVLARQFLEQARAIYASPARAFAPDTLAVMLSYSWPGNIRELSHMIERAVLLAQEELIQVEDLQLPKIHQAGSTVGAANPALDQLTGMTLDEAESYLIKRALHKHGGDVEASAAGLGLSRSALYRRMQKYGISS